MIDIGSDNHDQRKRPKLAILLASHNRRDLTLRALRALKNAPQYFEYHAVLFDDASIDGTQGAVEAEFPSTTIVKGDGTAFWNGGMYKAWQVATGFAADAYLWLNDDVDLDADAFERLAAAWHETTAKLGRALILVGATRSALGEITYSGMKKVFSPFALKFVKITPSVETVLVDTFNGNIVLVGGDVVHRIGLNDPAFFHALGDIDYGLRATSAGVPVLLLPGTLGCCEANRGFNLRGLNFRERVLFMASHRGLPFRNWLRMTGRHSGIWFPLHLLIPYRRLFIP